MEKKESLLPKSNTNNTAFEKKASLQPDLCFMDIYRSFDEKTTQEKLSIEYKQNPSFHLQAASELRYLSRKYKISPDHLNLICQDVINKPLDDKTKILLTQILKFSIIKDVLIEYDTLLQILRQNDNNNDIQRVIMSAIAYKIQKSNVNIEEKTIDQIELLVNQTPQSKEKTFLIEQIKRKQQQQNNNNLEENSEIYNHYCQSQFPANFQNQQKPGSVVTKTQQKEKQSKKKTDSEENPLNLQELIKKLKNRKQKDRQIQKKIKSPLEEEGNDRSWYRTTYSQVSKLYKIAIAEKKLKENDKNDYLPKIFIGINDKLLNRNLVFNSFVSVFSSRLLLNLNDSVKCDFANAFFMDLLIGETFRVISKNQELNDITLNKLMGCMCDISQLSVLILNTSDPDIIVEIFTCSNIKKKKYNDCPSKVKQIALEKIYNRGLRLIEDNWFFPSKYEIYPEVITGIVLEELKTFRLDCAKAIYNCTRRKETILTQKKERIEKLEYCLKMESEDRKFTQILHDTLCLLDNADIDYQQLFHTSLQNLENNLNIQTSLNFIEKQCHNEQKCQQLFNLRVIIQLSHHLINQNLQGEQKIQCIEIINNYLQYPFSELLFQELLPYYISIYNNINTDTGLRKELMMTFYLTATKTSQLPKEILPFILENLNHQDKTISHLTLIILEQICNKNEISPIEPISAKLLSNLVVITQPGGILLQEIQKDNEEYPQISQIAAKIIQTQLENQNPEITDKCIENLMSALESNDKQTRIKSAKIIKTISETTQLNEATFSTLTNYLNDEIHDISVYAQVSWLTSLQRQIETNEDYIPSEHMEYIPQIYAFESLTLGVHNYTQIVNGTILEILFLLANKIAFETSIFYILDHILSYDEENQKEALDILEKYTKNGQTIPQNSIIVLQSHLKLVESGHSIVLQILENIVLNSQRLTEGILKTLADNFYIAQDKDLREKSFSILDQAEKNSNQELPDHIFIKLEFQRAANILNSIKFNKKKTLSFLNRKTKEGFILPIDTVQCLIFQLNNNDTLQILENISSNNQNIPIEIIEELIKNFDPLNTCENIIQNNELSLQIFSNVANNNQDIPNILLEKLELGLKSKNDIIERESLQIITLQAEKGQKIPENIVNYIGNCFLESENDHKKHKFLSAFSPIIENKNSDFNRKTLKLVLKQGIRHENATISAKSIKLLSKSLHIIEINKKTKDLLIQLSLNDQTKQKTISDINHILDQVEITPKQQEQRNFANLKVDNIEQLLEELPKYTQQKLLINKIYTHLHQVFNNYKIDPKFHIKAQEILKDCLPQNNNFQTELLNSLAILSAQTKLKEIKTIIFEIFNTISDTGRKIDKSIISKLYSNQEEEEEEQEEEDDDENSIETEKNLNLKVKLLKEIGTKQHLSIQQKHFLGIQKAKQQQIGNRELHNLLNNIQNEQKKPEYSLTNYKIKTLYQIHLQKQDSHGYSNFLFKFAKIFASALTTQMEKKLFQNPQIVSVIEQAIQQEIVTLEIIHAYTIIVHEKTYKDLEKVLTIIVYILYQGSQPAELNIKLLSFISEAAQFIQLPQIAIEILEQKLQDQQDSSNLRRLCFQGLKYQLENGFGESQVYQNYFKQVKQNLERNPNIAAHVKAELDEYIPIFVCLDSIALQNISKLPKSRWKTELHMQDILRKLKVSKEEEQLFYKNWETLENHPQYNQGQSYQILQILNQTQIKCPLSFKEMNDILTFLLYTGFETAKNILNSPNSYQNIKQKWIYQHFLLLLASSPSKESNSYLEQIARETSEKYENVPLIEKILSSISNNDTSNSNIKDIQDIQEILEISHKYSIEPNDVQQTSITVKKMKEYLKIRALVKQFKFSSTQHKLEQILKNLLSKQYTFSQLQSILENLKLSKNTHLKRQQYEKQAIQIMEFQDQYKIPSFYTPKICQILKEKPPNEWLPNLNSLAIECNFQSQAKIKSSPELLQECQSANPNNPTIPKIIQQGLLEQVKNPNLNSRIELNFTDQMKNEFKNSLLQGVNTILGPEKKANKILSCSTSSLFPNDTSLISEWNKHNISQWASSVKSNKHYFEDPNFLIEAIAVIKRANFLFTGFIMTDPQILSCLLSLKDKENLSRGTLLQVATGEGKSTIVSVLAIFQALKGYKVDIVTSNPVLAERDAIEKAGLYKMFGLSCADNNDKAVYIKGVKKCYEKDILYGETAQYQFDILRDEYSQLGTRAGRKYDFVIVDEVDSMLIDDASKIARLSSTIPGMDLLQPIYHFIWSRLQEMKAKFLQIEGKLYFFYEEINHDQQGQLILQDGKNQECIIPNLKAYVQSTFDISDIGVLVEDLPTFLLESLTNYIEELIKTKIIQIPKCFKAFAESKKQLEKWIKNAILALEYEENVQYIVQNGQINPVDYFSTGIILEQTNWTDGLHQFLQIKHQLKMTSESFTTNFLSNIGFFQKYHNNITGLTGTFGSQKSQKVLEEVYKVDLLRVPRQKKRQFIELPPEICENDSKQIEKICESAINTAQLQRGVLIICENIQFASILEEKLRQKYKAGTLKLYTKNNLNQEKEVEKVYPGEIIIATNLAGRGTDIKTDNIEKYGGLHVILTFLPSNERVEEQAFGRTARQGKRGTAQMILSKSRISFPPDQIPTPQSIKKLRNDLEEKELHEFQQKELKIIQQKDTLFLKFCSLLQKIRQDFRQKRGIVYKMQEGIQNCFGQASTVQEDNLLLAVEEQWAMFLRELQFSSQTQQEMEKEMILFDTKYTEFETKILKDYDHNTVIKNPFYHIAIGNDMIINNSSLDDKYEEALNNFQKAIQLDTEFTSSAYAGKAWILLKGKENIIFNNEQSQNYKQESKKALEKALEINSLEMASKQSILNLISIQNQDQNQQESYIHKTDLQQQLSQKISILGSYSNSLENMLQILKKSCRLIDISCLRIYQNQNETETQTQTGNENKPVKRDDYNIKIAKKSDILEGIERKSNCKEQILSFLSKDSYDKYQVTFNDLIRIEDTIDKDQAIKTIEKGNQKRNIIIEIKQIPATQLKEILNPHIQIQHTTKQIAIDQLEDETNVIKRRILSDLSPDCELEILLPSGERESKQTLKSQKAIDILKAQTNENYRYNISLIDCNKNSKTITNEVLSTAHLNIEFLELSASEAQQKLEKIQSKGPYSVEITAQKNQQLIAIKKSNLSQITILQQPDKNTNTQQIETLYTYFAVDTIQKQAEEEYSTIKLEEINLESLKEVLESYEESIINLTFFQVDPSHCLQALSKETLNVNFSELKKEESKKLVNILRDQNLEFLLKFHSLDQPQLLNLIENASLDQEDIQISKTRSLDELFPHYNQPILELSEFSARGMQYLVEINEKKFVPWISVLTVSTMAGLQIAFGAALVGTGLGCTLGMTFITEGAADLFTAYRAYKTRQFSWSSYTKQKAVSMTISLATMGFQQIKNGFKATKNLIQGGEKAIVQQAGEKVIQNGTRLGTVVNNSTQSLQQLARQKIALSITEAASREVLNNAADFISSNLLETKVIPQISKSVQNKVKLHFSGEKLNVLVRKIYAWDKIGETSNKIGETLNMKGKMDKIVAETMNPQNNFWKNQWDTVGGPLTRGILSSSNKHGSIIDFGIKFLGFLNGCYQLYSIIDNVNEELIKKLSQNDKYQLKIHQLLSKYLQIQPKEALNITQTLSQQGIILSEEFISDPSLFKKSFHHVSNITTKQINPCAFFIEYINPLAIENDPLQFPTHDPPKTALQNLELGEHKSEIIEFFQQLHRNSQSMKIEDLSQEIKSISDSIVSQIQRIIEGQLISPVTTTLVSYTVNNISAKAQDKYNRKQIKEKYATNLKELETLTQKSELSQEEIQKSQQIISEMTENLGLLNTDQKLTFDTLIQHESNKKIIAFNQCATLYHAAQNKNKDTQNKAYQKGPSESVKQAAEKVRKGAPGSLKEAQRLAEDNGLDYKIIDNPNYKPTKEEISKGTMIIVFQPNAENVNGIGHYSLLDSNGKIIDIKSDKNDCLYSLFSHKTGKSVSQLRQETSDSFLNNFESISKAIESENIIKENFSENANSLLYVGGSKEKDSKSKENSSTNATLSGKEPPSKLSQMCDKVIEFTSKPENQVAMLHIATEIALMALPGGAQVRGLRLLCRGLKYVYVSIKATKSTAKVVKSADQNGFSMQLVTDILNEGIEIWDTFATAKFKIKPGILKDIGHLQIQLRNARKGLPKSKKFFSQQILYKKSSLALQYAKKCIEFNQAYNNHKNLKNQNNLTNEQNLNDFNQEFSQEFWKNSLLNKDYFDNMKF